MQGGAAEVFQGRGIPAAVLIRKGDSFGLILAAGFGHRHWEPQHAFYSCPLKQAWHFPLHQEDKLRRWKTSEERGRGVLGLGEPRVLESVVLFIAAVIRRIIMSAVLFLILRRTCRDL